MAEAKFGQSRSNRVSENAALSVLLTDARFQVPERAVKARLVELLCGPGPRTYGTRTFDAVMTPNPWPAITLENLDDIVDHVKLIEMKSTRKMKSTRSRSADATLNGFFFGATDNEYQMARALGDRYLFAFVVLGNDNSYGRPYAVLLTLAQVEQRTKTKRLQYQVNFRTDIDPQVASHEVVVFGQPESPLTSRAVEQSEGRW